LENVWTIDPSNDGKLLLTLYSNGDIRLFRRYINTGIRGRENIRYIQDTTNIINLPNTEFICISEDKTFFLTGEGQTISKFIINTEEYILNNSYSPFITVGNRLICLQITDNNIIASYNMIDFNSCIYVYDFDFNIISRIVRGIQENTYELESTQSSNDAQIISGLYRRNFRSLINIWIRNIRGIYFPVQMYFTPIDEGILENSYHVRNICISRNGRVLVSIIYNSLCIWYMSNDIIDNFILRNNNGETEITASEEYLQVIPLPEYYDLLITTFHITDNMEIIIGTVQDVLIFEKNEENIYSQTQIIPIFNGGQNSSSINIKSVLFDRNILNSILRNDYGNKKSKSPRRRSKKLKSSRRYTKKSKSSRRRSRRKKSVKRSRKC
jgi:hypothetical protein